MTDVVTYREVGGMYGGLSQAQTLGGSRADHDESLASREIAR